ncbi:MAG TPA: hypothetical protein VF450_24870 [Noviherbaspirillum sp.]|jgi:hypothetical protein
MANSRIEKAARAFLVVATVAVGVLAVSMSADLFDVRDSANIAGLAASSSQMVKPAGAVLQAQ